MSSPDSPKNNKAIFKFAIPVVLIIVLIAIVGFVINSGSKKSETNTSSNSSSVKASVDMQASELEKPKKEVAYSSKEDDKLSQQVNSLLKQKRFNKYEFNWYMGWWDASAKKKCNSDGTTINMPKMPADAGSIEIPKKRLMDIIPLPTKPEKTSIIEYPKQGSVSEDVKVPLVYTNLEDRFEKNADGTINFNKTFSDDPIGSPIQQKLRKGVILEPMAPQPGETGNAYISGHTSNFKQVDSKYNEAFKPLESKTKAGERFYIFDCEGRKLSFKVFEAKEIRAEDTEEAWKDYPDRRVVTLQGSILKQVNGVLQPTHRWLTRGELDVEDTLKINK
jgi:sortase (surface protein transpeptidase)